MKMVVVSNATFNRNFMRRTWEKIRQKRKIKKAELQHQNKLLTKRKRSKTKTLTHSLNFRISELKEKDTSYKDCNKNPLFYSKVNTITLFTLAKPTKAGRNLLSEKQDQPLRS